MPTRRSAGLRPQLVFTSDFNEFLRGDFVPGTCNIRYDPHRVVPEGEVSWLPTSQRPIHVDVRYHPSGGTWEGLMLFPPGGQLLVDRDDTGGGTMLELPFPLPADCDELELWFSYESECGEKHWDSNSGKNYWVRFPGKDLDLQRAEILGGRQAATNAFQFEAETIGAVETVTLRWQYTYPQGHRREEVPLIPVAAAGGRKAWAPPGGAITVACGCTIAYDVVYTVGGHKFTDDNDGTWFLVTAT